MNAVAFATAGPTPSVADTDGALLDALRGVPLTRADHELVDRAASHWPVEDVRLIVGWLVATREAGRLDMLEVRS